MQKPDKVIITIDEYIATFPENIKTMLEKIRLTIKKSAPDATETISYGMPALKQNGMLVYFAAYKNHIGFYPTSSAIIEFKDELSRYQTSKGTVRFSFDKPIPYGLIKKIVEFRVRKNMEKKKKSRT
jgi:uncharacterized protein YdhG (YjbR/CyaY superfamily)